MESISSTNLIYAKMQNITASDKSLLTNDRAIIQKDNSYNSKTIENKSLSKKISLGLGALSAIALSVVYGIKKYNVKNIKNIQKAFQEVFMRDDITLNQTREIMNRYKNIEKIENKEEYIKAMFKEAKKNFGFENSSIKLVIDKLKYANGQCTNNNSYIIINTDISRRQILDTIHHEFRHAKQNYLANPEKYHRAELDKLVEEAIDNGNTETNLLEQCIEQLRNKIVPAKYKNWTENIRNGFNNYLGIGKDFVGTWNNIVEQDARKAGRKMSKYVRAKVFTPIDWCKDTYMKIRTFLTKR